MRRTVAAILGTRAPNSPDAAVEWAKRAAIAIDEIQRRANDEYRGVFTHTTTNTATFETAWTSDSLPENSASAVDAEIIALATDGSAARYRIAGLFKRATGTASQVGATAAVVPAIEDVAGWAVQFSTSGNSALVQVQGDAARVVGWTVYVTVRELV